jgi:hypothetical protein
MKKLSLLLLVLFMASVTVGCQPKKEEPKPAPTKPAGGDAEKPEGGSTTP